MKTFNNLLWSALFSFICYGVHAQTTSTVLGANSNIGSRNVFLGAMAGESATNPAQNTFIGYEAGANALSTHNTFIGSRSGINCTGSSNTFIGVSTGSKCISSNNVFIGTESGMNSTIGTFSVFIGRSAGKHHTTYEGSTYVGAFAGSYSNNEHNTFMGYGSGMYTEGRRNSFVGTWSGRDLTAGEENVLFGTWAAVSMTSGNRNTMLGTYAGQHKISGNNNTYVGYKSGRENQGSGNVFIGYESGKDATGNNQLYIENSDTVTAPLIYGDFENDKVGINTNDVPEGYTLAVRGDIIAEEIRLKLYADGWPDYVFERGYNLLTLEETAKQIETLGHLPGVPSAEEVGKNGVQIGEMNTILLEKIEELTLHLIDINENLKDLQKENQALKNRVIELEK